MFTFPHIKLLLLLAVSLITTRVILLLHIAQQSVCSFTDYGTMGVCNGFKHFTLAVVDLRGVQGTRTPLGVQIL